MNLGPDAPALRALYFAPRRRLMFRLGTYGALIRTMAVGHLVKAFYGHSQLVAQTHARLARTRQTLRDLIWHGFESAEGEAAVARLLQAHRHVVAAPEDYAYVLSVFVLEPLRWNDAAGGPPLSAGELALLLGFWDRVGRAMAIPALPRTLADWQAFQAQYERRRWRYTDEGRRLASMCLDEVVTLSLPWGTRSLFRQLMRVTMDPALRELLKLPAPAGLPAAAMRSGLRVVLRRHGAG